MPIALEELERNFIAVDGTTTVAELHARVGTLERSIRYVVISLPGGRYAVVLLNEVADAVSRLGPTALDLPLADLPGVAEPTGAVQRTAMGIGDARDRRDDQPRARLVVLDGERPLGLLADESLGGGVGGLMFDLFGSHIRESSEELANSLVAEHRPRTCPLCRARFTWYDVDPVRKAYLCPECHGAVG